MRVIFLDIDGVLNSELFYRKRHKKRKLTWNYWKYWIISKVKYVFNGFKYKSYSLKDYKIPRKHTLFPYLFNMLKEETDYAKWQWLIELVKDTDAKICISSTWKNHFKHDWEWELALLQIGFPKETYIGRTPNLRSPLNELDFHEKAERGYQIQAWINSITNPLISVEDYVILDDDSDMLSEQMSHFFHCDNYVGLTPTICYRIKKYFNK